MEEIELKDVIKVILDKKLQIILIVCIFIVIGVMYLMFLQKPKYTAVTSLLLTSSATNEEENMSSITTTDLTLNSKLIPTYSELVKSKKVIEEVISNLGIDIKEETIKKNISVTAKQNTDLIEISVTLPDPSMAGQVTNETAEVFIKFVKEYYNVDNLKVVDKAITPMVASNENDTKDIVIFALIGVVVSGIYIFLLSVLDNTVKEQEEIEAKYKIPVLAVIPSYSKNMERKIKR